MDGRDQKTIEMESEAVSENINNDEPTKGSVDEELENQFLQKNSSDTVTEKEENAFDTNGIDNEFVQRQQEIEGENVSGELKGDLMTSKSLEDNSSSEDVNLSGSEKEHISSSTESHSKNAEEEEEINLENSVINQNLDNNITISNVKDVNISDETISVSVQERSKIINQNISENQFDKNESTENEKKESDLKCVDENIEEDNVNIQQIETVNSPSEELSSSEPSFKNDDEEQKSEAEDVNNDVSSSEKESNFRKEKISEADVSSSSFTDISDSQDEINYQQECKKSEDTNQFKDHKETEVEKVTTNEADAEIQNLNTSIHDSSSSQSILNSSVEQDEESVSKIENEAIEILDTEMVNCNEIEQIDFSENEIQKDKDIDRIGIEISDICSKDKSKEESDVLETVAETCEKRLNQGDSIITEDVSGNQPGNSEEETITGDTNNPTIPGLPKNKDDVCIIPDDVTPKLPVVEHNKSSVKETKNSELESCGRRLRQNSDKGKNKLSDKKNDVVENSKLRPVRNAAKLAGNKIKSLVENDLVFEDNVSGNNAVERVQESKDGTSKMCTQCREMKLCKFIIKQGDNTQYLCSDLCSQAYKNAQIETETNESETSLGECLRKCAQCHSQVVLDDKCLFWETMDFCNEDCLEKYQTELGSNCANCKGNVAASSLGKYCVRFGYDVKQFCSATCLEEYKKGLKVCSYCQKDISTGAEGFLAPVGDKGQFKDFCTQSCMEKYERMSCNVPPPDIIEECAVCSNSKPVRVEVELDRKTHKLCSEPCFAAFKFVNNITEGQCDMCRKYFDRTKTGNFSLFYDDSPHSFCCKTCMNVYILAHRKVVPCNWCKVKKYNFDMIKKVSNGQLTMMCSLNCLTLYQVSVNAVCSRRVKCDFCLSVTQAQYHLTMSDATIRNFCSYNCVISFQVMKKKLDMGLGESFASIAKEFFALQYHNRYSKQTIDLLSGSDQLSSPIPTGGPKRVTPRRSQVESSCVPVISSVQSLAPTNGPSSPSGRVIPRVDPNMVTQVSPTLTIPSSVPPIPTPPPQVYQQIITKPPPAKQMKNKSILCKPYSHTKGVSCRPHPCMKETQTDQSLTKKFLIPIPVPIFIPAPMHMFATPFPVPVPFPLPVPVPVFIPTTRNSAKGIFKEIKKIQEKIPTDPFEAELLMMAEMVAGEKKQDPTDSESEDGNEGDDGGDGTFSPENVDTSNTFGDDMLQMALKMASELEEPAVDMESVLTSNTITTTTQPAVDPNKALYASDPDDPDQVHVMSMNRSRKRTVRGSRNSTGGTPSKRGRRTSGCVDVPLLPPPEPVPPPRIEVEKPDANMCLKYTFGVNAWRHWVMQKNAELEKAAMTNRKIKLFKPELLQLTADELNFSLCLFVKEVRKPNGTEYAPDTIYYLCLGIQQYLFENGRIDNIFTDSYYEKFTDCLDEVAKKFAALYNDSQYIVTRVEEEHLWESKQLGAHSPHVLLSTLMFFNTKHFNLVTVEEHMQLSFSHIMKHWKRNPNSPGVAKIPGSRNVLLRFYPPQSALEANSRKKKVYEQQENEENPLRCPVKLYEFYLSKCPESVKTRNDVFYLLPERSCVPDSPVWYSTMALGKEPLMKMLHRVKMVKEINIALLSC